MKHVTIAAAVSACVAATSGLAWSQNPGESDLLEEIVVTATRREESLQDVPVTVSVISSEQLAHQNITGTSGLVPAVPSLTITNYGIYQIRGIGTQGFGRSSEQSVSMVLDGVVLNNGLLTANSVYDLERVEVLSGPQGTLFGKNATAGVINIVTKAPQLGQYELIGHADVGTQDYINAHLIGNLALGSSAALRLTGHVNTSGHTIYNTVLDKWDYRSNAGGRARFLWKPSDNLTLNVTAQYDRGRSNGIGGMFDIGGVSSYRVADTQLLVDRLAECGIVASSRNNRTCGNTIDPNVPNSENAYDLERRGAALQIDWDLWEGYRFTSISAWNDSHQGDFDLDANVAGYLGDSLLQNLLDRNLTPVWIRTVSEEARIQSPTENAVSFLAGFYYSATDSHGGTDQAGQFGIPLGALQFRRVNDNFAELDNYAFFGNLTYKATDRLELLVGARYTSDDIQSYTFNSFPAGPFIYTGNKGFFSLFPISTCTLAGGDPDDPSSCPAGTSLTTPAKISETGISWDVGAKYRLSSDVMFFATAKRGYKGPFINDAASFPILGSQLVVKPEYPMAYEVGVKSQLFGRFALNATVFYSKIKDFQTTVFVPESDENAVSSFIQGNADHAITQGVDLELFGNLTDDFSASISLLYNDAHFNKGFIVPCAAGPCEAVRQLPYSPKWKGNLALEYKRNLFGAIDGFVQTDFSYSSSYPYNSRPDIPVKSDGREVLGARLGIRPADERWSASAFCRNCFNQFNPLTEGISFPGDGGGPLTVQQYVSLDSHRVVGITMDARF